MIHRITNSLVAAITLLFSVSGCATTESDPTQIELSLPTKSVADTDYRFDQFEKERAIRAYRRLRAEILFELVIDREGHVQKLNVVKTKMDDYSTIGFSGHVSGMKFTPAPANDPHPYRALFYPLQVDTKLELR
jgi:hypothetical protein